MKNRFQAEKASLNCFYAGFPNPRSCTTGVNSNWAAGLPISAFDIFARLASLRRSVFGPARALIIAFAAWISLVSGEFAARFAFVSCHKDSFR
jgi:hypothetical protein